MMQFNMYHHYTVDEHLIRSIGVLAEIERGNSGEDHPLSTDLILTLQNRKVLYVAMFPSRYREGPSRGSLRRRGTGCPQDLPALWPERGGKRNGRVAHRTSPRHEHDRSVARPERPARQSRISRRPFQSLERLKMLLILTVADIRAVGPGVFNGWKGQLLRTLFYATEPHLSGGHSKMSHNEAIESAKRLIS